jgi:hypothetical protein
MLPKLETPTYELTIPSNGKKVKYRPFLVKEYKILLTSLEADTNEIIRVVNELVDVCTFNKLKMSELAHFDVEYLFLQIRAKSVSEIANLIIDCDCGTKIPYDLDITKIQVTNNDKVKSNKVMLADKIGVELRYPRFEEMMEIYENLQSDKIVDMIGKCIVAVYTDKERIDAKDTAPGELQEFLESLTKQQFDQIEKFFVDMPKLVQDVEKECPSCKTINNVKLEGIQNFFV